MIGYDIEDPDTDYRFALAAIAIDSADAALMLGSLSDDILDRLYRILLDDSDLLAYLIHYWCCFDATNADEYFTITPFIRKAWNAIYDGSIPTTLPEDDG